MKKIFEFGIAAHYQNFKNTAIIASNKVYLALLVPATLAFIVSLYFVWDALPYAAVFLVIPGVSLWLNYGKASDFSRIFFSISIALFASALNALPVFPGEPLINHFSLLQITALVIPWLLFDTRESGLLSAATIVSAVLLLFQPEIARQFTMAKGADVLKSSYVAYLCYGMVLLLTPWGLFHLKLVKKSYEIKTAETKKQIAERSTQMANRQKELQDRISEINQTHKIEEQRSWVAQGISQIIDLMRSSRQENLYEEVIKEIVKYMNAPVGYLYVVEEDDREEKVLKLEGCYAYDRRKTVKASVPFGDGVLGQSCIDKEILYLDGIPSRFLHLTSGLGDAPPSYLAVVPLMEEANVMGAVEIASHHPFEPHEKDLLSQISSSIGSFIYTNTVNQKIKVLIEQNQQQAEEMKAQEEEMLQNLEELHATQEEMARKEKEYVETIETLEKQLESK